MSELLASPDLLQVMLIRDLVNDFPDTMPVLNRLGLDMCCGGSRKLGDALKLHGIEPDAPLAEIAAIVGTKLSPDGNRM